LKHFIQRNGSTPFGDEEISALQIIAGKPDEDVSIRKGAALGIEFGFDAKNDVVVLSAIHPFVPSMDVTFALRYIMHLPTNTECSIAKYCAKVFSS